MKLLFAISVATLLIIAMPVAQYRENSVRSPIKQQIPEEKPLFSFGIISDVQYADCNPIGERHYRSSLDKLKEAVSVFKKDSVSFIINLGDLIDNDYESFKPVINILNTSGIRTYHISGNHDYSVDPRYLGRLPVFTESREGYYSIIYKKYRFIFTNGNEISTYATANKTQIKLATDLIARLKKNGAPNAIEWNGGIGQQQIVWITSQLEEAADNSEKVIMVCHFPIAPENIHNLLNSKDINDLIFKYSNVVAWFSGHNHEGNYCFQNNIHFVTFKGMVETKKTNSFAIVDAFSDKLTIRGYGRQTSQILSF